MDEMGRLGFVSANAAIFFVILLSELARSKVLLEGGGSEDMAKIGAKIFKSAEKLFSSAERTNREGL